MKKSSLVFTHMISSYLFIVVIYELYVSTINLQPILVVFLLKFTKNRARIFSTEKHLSFIFLYHCLYDLGIGEHRVLFILSTVKQ